jgi:hypothetical protein
MGVDVDIAPAGQFFDNSTIEKDEDALAFELAAQGVVSEEEVLKEVGVTAAEGYELPTAKVARDAVIQLQAVTAGSTLKESTAVGALQTASLGAIMDKLASGDATIVEGSTTERLMLEVDGQVYLVVGNDASLIVDGALEVEGYFGTYVLTSVLVSGGYIDLKDDKREDVITLDLDGTTQNEES